MSSEKDLEFWLNFVSDNEEKETTLEEITFMILKEYLKVILKV